MHATGVYSVYILFQLFQLRMLELGLTLLAFLVKWVAFLGTLHWPADRDNLGLGCAFLKLKCLFCWSCGLARGGDPGAQLQCRLFHLVQTLIFGSLGL